MDVKRQEIEALVKKATNEVLGKLGYINEQNLTSSSRDKKKDKGVLVIVPQYVVSLDEFLKYISKKYPTYEITLAVHGKIDEQEVKRLCKSEIYHIENEDSRLEIQKRFSSFSDILCISPGIKQMETIVQGDERCFITNLFIRGLLSSKRVQVLVEYNVNDMKNNLLTKKIKELLSTIEGLGAAVNTINSRHLEPSLVTTGKTKLVTQDDIDNMWKNGIKQLEAGKGCIITPLAKDRAREIGLSINYKL